MSKVTLASVGSIIDATTAAATINSNNAAIVAAVDNTISRDGTNPNQMNADLDLNSKSVINIRDAINNNEAVNYGQLLALLAGTAVPVTPTPIVGVAGNGYGGRLTASPGNPKLSSDVISTKIWYSPYIGGSLNVQGNTVNFLSGATDQNGWFLDISALAAGKYHVCANLTGLYTIPYATVLTRYAGVLSDPATNNPYLGSICLFAAGQITCHVSADYDRRWSVYNYYNKLPVTLSVLTQERDIAYNPRNQYPAFQAFNNNANNKATIFTGQPENVEATWYAQCFMDTTGVKPYGIITAIGWNSTTNSVGRWAGGTIDDGVSALGRANITSYSNPNVAGDNIIYMLVAAAVNSIGTNSVIDSSETPSAGVYEAGRDNIMYVRWLG